MTVLQVGQKYSEYAIRRDHIAINFDEDGTTSLYLFLKGVSYNEKRQMSAGSPFNMNMFDDGKGALVFTFKLGSMNWMDSVYVPYRDKAPAKIGNMLMLHVFDSRDGTLLINRMLGIPSEFVADIEHRLQTYRERSISGINQRIQAILSLPTKFYVENAVAAWALEDGTAAAVTMRDYDSQGE